ncbi:SDR family oxidoreductase [Dactylosporangium sp. NPDC005555]|uniref:SDR family oxidoreductase n=1 Tax=Dactylosporangium sp. NPDC005555 TaxID=3154889 RepID=UPI0033BB20AD
MTTATVALVTGANKGIGFEIAARLGALGWTVGIGARDAERREEAVAKLRAGGADAFGVALDVTGQASVDAAAAEVGARHGRLDVLVNNAGIIGGTPQEPSTVDLAVVHAAVDTNVYGVIRVTNAFLPLLRRSPRPRIVNMSSSVGSFAEQTDPDGPLSGMPPSVAYAPSKAFLNAVTVQYAKELGDTGILVNLGCPGYCATDLNHHSGFRTAAQGAEIAVRLATLPDDGPSGGFFDDEGTVRW